MSTQKIVVIGAGGLGREVLDLIEAINVAGTSPEIDVIGLLADPVPSDDLFEVFGVTYLGGVSKLSEMPLEVGYVLAIGSSEARKRLSNEYEDRWSPVLVHPSAAVGRAVTLGPGTIVCANVTISNHTTIGNHGIINMNCSVGHDVSLGNWVTVSPGVSISGHCRLHDCVFVGTGAVIRDRRTIGEGAVIGMGSAVLGDVRPGTTVIGVPARQIPQA